MKNRWTDILVPVTLVGLTLAETLGVETSRVLRHRSGTDVRQIAEALRAAGDTTDTLAGDVVPADTFVLPDTLAAWDSLVTDSLPAPADTLDEEDFDLFGFSEQVDTTPFIPARDTMRVPDSLRYTDPFLFRWYVATKDSLTHRIVVDSLRAEGDSLDWPRIDSLYLADSTKTAIDRFNRWYASLTKAERRKYDYEQKLPAILHRQDSIMHRKDSIRARRDSIIENTPRILETAFLPDSLYYKRLVAWRHDAAFNRVKPFEFDTTFNYRFNDYPYMKEDVGGTFLGMPGSAVQTFNFLKRDGSETVSFYEAYESWTHSRSSIPMFNTKTPYTELEYHGNLFNSKTTASDDFRVFTTQNILPSLNVALEFKRYGGAGKLKNEATANKTAYVTANYLGKRYLAHAGIIHNTVARTENGGIVDNTWIRDTLVDVREIDVHLAAAKNTYRKNSLFFDQSYRIPLSVFKDYFHRHDSTYVKDDTLNVDQTTTFIGTTTEWTTWSKTYTDEITAADPYGSAFYHDVFYLNPSKSTDSLRVSRLENRVFLRFQPWREDAVVSKIEGGIGHRIQNHYRFQAGDYLRKPQDEIWRSTFVYAGAEGRLRKYIDWDALGEYTFAGTQVNDFSLDGGLTLNLFPFRRHPKSPLTLSGRFNTSLREPGYYEKHFYSNHYRWDHDDFGKVSVTRVDASLSIPRWQLRASVGYALLANNIWYDSLGVVRQNSTPMSVLSATLEKNFTLAKVIHLDNKVLFQYSSNPEVVPLPQVALNLRWYLQMNIVRADVMKMQLGVNAFYNTRWYMPGYNPVAGVFYNQQQELYGACPRFDAFMNVQWKKCCIFIKYENMGRGWPMESRDYFSAHGYVHAPSIVKVGISWPFYPDLSAGRTLSSQAGAAVGGGGGSGGRSGSGLGGLGGGIGGGLGGGRSGNSSRNGMQRNSR